MFLAAYPRSVCVMAIGGTTVVVIDVVKAVVSVCT